MPLLLMAGLLNRAELQGAIAAGTAFSVGFGASHGLRGHRWGAMLGATVGIAGFAFLGSVAGGQPWIFLGLAGAAAAVCACLAMIDDDLWWVVLQMVIALLVSGSFAGTLANALERGLLSLAGGVTQTVIVVSLSTLFPRFVWQIDTAPRKDPTRALMVDHALRAAVSVIGSLLIAQSLHLANSYWAPMTAILLIKPGLHATRTRGVERLLGTFAGGVVATLYVYVIQGRNDLVLFGLALTASAAFALQKANYASLTAAITATIVLLTSLAYGTVLANAEHRFLATLLGGVVTLIVAWVPLRIVSGSR